jgi:hypothetical protein
VLKTIIYNGGGAVGCYVVKIPILDGCKQKLANWAYREQDAPGDVV